MSHTTLRSALLLSLSLLLAACVPTPLTPPPAPNLPNPASVFCEEHGGALELRTDASGGVAGVCVFPDGSECDEWAYFRGECGPVSQDAAAPVTTEQAPLNMPNPASVFCEEHGGALELRTDASGGVAGVCVFPDGSECDEWAYFRGECSPASQGAAFPTPLPIDPVDYEGWWIYTHPVHGFTLRLPADWIVDEVTSGDPLLNGHLLTLRPQDTATEGLAIRLAFRRAGEETLLWPTGVGAGEFAAQGTLDVAGGPARRVAFVCPTGQVNSLWYQGVDEANIQRGDLAFSFIFGYTGVYCQEGYSLGGKVQRVGEMIIASLETPLP